MHFDCMSNALALFFITTINVKLHVFITFAFICGEYITHGIIFFIYQYDDVTMDYNAIMMKLR